jgi:hypothetical protein
VKYMLLIYANTSQWDNRTDDEREAITQEYMAIAMDQSVTVHSEQLQPGETATTVKVQDGSTLTTDGPFIETKEELGGYYLIDVPDLDAAIEVAAKLPAARMGGGIEVRPVVER